MKINILANLPQDIEITENATPESNRVKIMAVISKINYIYYKILK